MRRRLGLVALVALLVFPATSAGAAVTPSAHAEYGQVAYASWMVHDGDHMFIYFASAMNGVPGDWPSMAFVGRAKCRAMGHHNFMCRGREKGIELMPGDFVVDATLSGADLLVNDGETTHEVSWSGQGAAPKPYIHQHAGTDVGLQVISMLQRRATASGSLFGADVDRGRGLLVEGGYFDIYLDSREGLDIGRGRVWLRDGTLFVRERISLR